METMSDPVIRLLAIEDLDAALALSTTAGWNQRLDDWRMLLRLAPAGSFAALAEGRIVGTAIGIDYGGFAWIAMMLVDPAHRGRGVGRCLLEAAMGAVPSDLPIRLDATPLGRPLYQRYGFEDEAMLTRHVISAANPPAPRLPPSPRLRRTAVALAEAGRRVRRSFTRRREPRDGSSRVQRLTAADLKIVTKQDNEVFGGNRDEVLEWALDSAPQYGHVVQSNAGLAHYCLGRQGRLFDQIGPVVAGDDDIAQALVNAALTAAGGRPVVVDAFDSHSTFTASLGACGFQIQRPLFRMCRPSSVPSWKSGDRFSGARRPAGKARRPRIPGVFEEGATPSDGMPRPENVSGFPTRDTSQVASSDTRIGVRNRPPLVEFAILGPEFA